MKLAEALSLRAEYQKNLSVIESRLHNSVKVQDGDNPLENPTKLFSELNSNVEALEKIIVRINYTNLHVKFADGSTMTEKLAQRDVLKKHINILRSIYNATAIREERYNRQEIKFVCTIDVNDLSKKIDSLSKQLRVIDMEIQEANWLNELL